MACAEKVMFNKNFEIVWKNQPQRLNFHQIICLAMNEANDKLVKLFQRKKSSWNEESSSNNLTGDYEPVDLNVYYRFNNGKKNPKISNVRESDLSLNTSIIFRAWHEESTSTNQALMLFNKWRISILN